MNQNNAISQTNRSPLRHNAYSGYFPNNHNRLCSPERQIISAFGAHSKSVADLQPRSESLGDKVLAGVSFIALIALIILVPGVL